MSTDPEQYVPVTKQELVDVLADVLKCVLADDSWEGFVNWMIPDYDEVPEGTVAMLHARYRVGNADGSQGGMRVVGNLI